MSTRPKRCPLCNRPKPGEYIGRMDGAPTLRPDCTIMIPHAPSEGDGSPDELIGVAFSDLTIEITREDAAQLADSLQELLRITAKGAGDVTAGSGEG